MYNTGCSFNKMELASMAKNEMSHIIPYIVHRHINMKKSGTVDKI
jgi:hypothetical protein